MEKEIELYLNWKSIARPRAFVSYRRSLTKFAKICDKKIGEIVPEDLIRFNNQCLGRYAPSTLRYDFTVLKNFFKFCKMAGYKCLHPDLVAVPRSRSNPHHVLSYDEFLKLVRGLNEDEFYALREILIIRLLFETGVRVSELCALNVSNIDTVDMKALIPTKKNTLYREIYWSKETHRLLLKYLGVRLCINQTPPLFIAKQRHTRLTPRSIERFFRVACARAGISSHIVPHSARHGRSHRILDLGGDITIVAGVLGHKDIRSSQWYTQFNNKELEAKARRCLR